ncbi:hypothetical protein BaRGS_00036765 [Batillaria attramentaria]|uniref:Uncharacterized protein n=1 Tax=Batillaria attramentaria TaxID=370345 RepID=A0ABD0JBG9_9CAEN
MKGEGGVFVHFPALHSTVESRDDSEHSCLETASQGVNLSAGSQVQAIGGQGEGSPSIPANRDSALEGTGARVDVSSQSTRDSLQRANDSSLHSTKAVRSTQPSGSQQRVGCGTRGGPNTRSRVQSSNNSLGCRRRARGD